jgi:hypothetical protein
LETYILLSKKGFARGINQAQASSRHGLDPQPVLKNSTTDVVLYIAWKTEVLDQKYYRANGPLSEFVSDVQSPEVEIISGDMGKYI